MIDEDLGCQVLWLLVCETMLLLAEDKQSLRMRIKVSKLYKYKGKSVTSKSSTKKVL